MKKKFHIVTFHTQSSQEMVFYVGEYPNFQQIRRYAGRHTRGAYDIVIDNIISLTSFERDIFLREVEGKPATLYSHEEKEILRNRYETF